MIVNPGKFRSIIIDNNNINYNPQVLNIGNNTSDSQQSVKLLGIVI